MYDIRWSIIACAKCTLPSYCTQEFFLCKHGSKTWKKCTGHLLLIDSLWRAAAVSQFATEICNRNLQQKCATEICSRNLQQKCAMWAFLLHRSHHTHQLTGWRSYQYCMYSTLYSMHKGAVRLRNQGDLVVKETRGYGGQRNQGIWWRNKTRGIWWSKKPGYLVEKETTEIWWSRKPGVFGDQKNQGDLVVKKTRGI